MSIKALCAAAAVVVTGVGAADAATTANFDLWLRYEGTSFDDVLIYPLVGEDPDPSVINIPVGDTSYGIRSQLFGSLDVGNIIRMVVTLVHPEDDIWIGAFDNGGRTPVCQIGPWDCTRTTLTSFGPRSIGFGYDDLWWWQIGGVSVGDRMFLSHANYELNFPLITDDGSNFYYYWNEASDFTVVSGPAPVPLPATAALLPMGLGALALMKKRRRKTT